MTATSETATTSKSSSYYTLAILTTVYSFNFIDRQLLSILQVPIKKELLLSDGQLGLLTGFAFALFYVVAGLPIASYADRSNRRNIIAWSLGIWSFMTAISGLALNYIQLLLARIGVGIGEAGCSPPSHSIISDIFPENQRATGLSIYSLGINFGILLGFILGGWLNEFFGWRVAFMVVGIPGILLAILLRFTVQEPTRGQSEARTSSSEHHPFSEVIATLWSRKSFRYLGIAGGMSAFAGYGLTTWMAPFLSRVFAMNTGEIGTVLGLGVGVFGGLGTFLSGWIADKMGRKDMRWYLWMPAIASLIMVPSIILGLMLEQKNISLIVMMLPIFLSNVFLSVCIAMTHGLVGIKMRAVGSAVFFFIINIVGLGLGPVSIGFLSDYLEPTAGVDSIRYAMVILTPLAALIAAACYFKAAKTLREDLQRAPN
jgi:predicted MFS family arabinose efflux permease